MIRKRPGKRIQGGAGASYRGSQIGRSDHLTKGPTYNMICDRCGFKCKSNQIKQEWTGLMTCDATVNNCWEPRNAQDFVRGIPDKQSVLPARPDPNNSEITYWQYPCIAGIALTGVSVCGTGYIKSNNANG